MPMPHALLSVHDKTGLVPFARELVALGWTLLASGGTARALHDAGVPVEEVSAFTGAPELLGGRVKTLHPAIHAGLLARPTPADRAELAAHSLAPIDLAVVNLYPFAETVARPGVTLAEAIEQIDIGGVALVRAAAKNFARVTLVCNPSDYPAVLDELRAGGPDESRRRALALKGFALTAEYDAAILAYLSHDEMAATPLSLTLYPVQELRYGENPHQRAQLYSLSPVEGPLGGRVLQGKELSYNNLLDLDAAWYAVESLTAPSAAIVKHLSPCGLAAAPALAHALELAIACDPVSAFGGVVATNRPVDELDVAALGDLFIECFAAPSFSPGALSLLAKRKNLRLVELPPETAPQPHELRSVRRGVLRQQRDTGDPPGTEWTVVSRRVPDEDEWRALRFAWHAVQHVKSNGIVLARAFGPAVAAVGIGGGQPNRVDSVRIAVARARDRARGAVLASDAFFPFPDSVEVAAQAGVTAIIHPGGSVRDDASLSAADAAGVAMVLTHVRHFKH